MTERQRWFLIFCFANALDLVTTLRLVASLGVATEMNPLLDFFLQRSEFLFVFVKLSMSLACAVLLSLSGAVGMRILRFLGPYYLGIITYQTIVFLNGLR